MKSILGTGCLIGLVLLAGCSREPLPVLKMGTDAQFPPFEMRGGADNSAIVGFDVDLAQAIAKKARMQLEVVDMPFSECLPALERGEVDMVLAGLTITPERAERVDFSDPYYTSTQVAVYRGIDPPPADKAALQGRRIGAQAGTTGAAAAKSMTDREGFRAYDSGRAAVVGLLNMQVDVVLLDEQPAIHIQKQFERDAEWVRLDFSEEQYGVAVRKGNTNLLAQINEVLAEVSADGRMDRWLQQWMVDVPESAAAAGE